MPRRNLATTSESGSEVTDENENESNEAVGLEPWQEFLQRTAQWVEESLDQASLRQWPAEWSK